MNREDFIDKIITQVEAHTFYHLHKDRRTGESESGWPGGILMYSPNMKKPEPEKHVFWVKEILSRIRLANTISQKSEIANEILSWGGMRLRVNDYDNNFHRVLKATHNASEEYGAPMNSSYTKIASLFGYNLIHNTIWDSRVSSAICYRLALIAEENNTPPQRLRSIFPDIGYIPGQSKRYKRRELLLEKYWKSVYGKWSGHRAGAKLLTEISTALQHVGTPCPEVVHPLTNDWNSWLVNMVFFVDDLPNQKASDSTVQKRSMSLISTDTQTHNTFWEWVKHNTERIPTLKHKDNKTISASVVNERLVICAGNDSEQTPISRNTVFRYIDEYEIEKSKKIIGNKRYVIALYYYWSQIRKQ